MVKKLLIIVLCISLALTANFVLAKVKKVKVKPKAKPAVIKSVAPKASPSPSQSKNMPISDVSWQMTNGIWKPSGTPPECPSPLILKTPVELIRATSVLYPGQYRGTDYKPHGGLRFDNSKSDDITVLAPMDAVVFRGARYLADGEIQYSFDFIAPCGIMYRFGHLRALSSRFAQIADKFPPAKEGDSRQTEVYPVIRVTAGEIIATAVGFFNTHNVFIDWGVYDLRKRNAASEDPVWANAHGQGEQAPYAVCWLDWLSVHDAETVRSLPGADGVNGKKSDYCK